MRVCSQPGCPELVDSGRCAEHRCEYERERGSKAERGYDSEHVRKRYLLARAQKRGLQLICARCTRPIGQDEDFHLGHTDDRTTWSGPEHVLCNLSAAGHARWRNS